MKIHDIDQLSDEWFDLRKGKMTASHAQAIASAGRGLDNYVYEIVADMFSIGEKEHYTNADIERGIELEDMARDTYQIEHSVVEQVGFIEIDKYTGLSPDGLVGDDGGVEIKCFNDVKHLKLICDGPKVIDSKYKWQVQMSLLLTGRDWWDLALFNPNFDRSLIVHRVLPDPTSFEKLEKGIAKGKKLIREKIKRYELQ